MATELQNMISRLKTLEASYNDTDDSTECVVIIAEDCSKNGNPQPITKFSFGDQDIYLEPGESFEDFEARAKKAALESRPPTIPGTPPGLPRPIPVLIGTPGEVPA